ncbi:MAG: dephospho-CoA kinase [Peptoniphilaceae bacterium]|nr:dephospho-CoA kinase [Peptoniphilaceae bacterium]
MRIGLTGGIASGKSMVTKYLQQAGYPVIDADAIVHELMLPGKKLYQALVAHFGCDILLEDGNIDRRRLGSIVFQDAIQRKKLDSLSHPVIYQEMEERALSWEKAHGNGLLFFDIPLLMETWDRAKALSMDEVWVVDAPLKLRISRIMKRDGLTRREAVLRIQSQMGEERFRLADCIIRNDGTISALYGQIEEALKRVKKI